MANMTFTYTDTDKTYQLDLVDRDFLWPDLLEHYFFFLKGAGFFMTYEEYMEYVGELLAEHQEATSE